MAKGNVNVGSYMRRTKSGKMVRVDAYNQSRDLMGGISDLLKADGSRPSNNAKSGQFAGGSSVPGTSSAMQAAQKRVRAATAKASAPKKTSGSKEQAFKRTTPEPTKKTAAKKTAAKKTAASPEAPQAFKRTTPAPTKKAASSPESPAAKKASAPKAPAAKKAAGTANAPQKAAAPQRSAAPKAAAAPQRAASQRTPSQSSGRAPAAASTDRGGPPLLRGIPRGQYTRETMTPAEQKKRSADVVARIDRTLAVGDTQRRHSTPMKSKMAGGVDVVYSPERARIHKEIISEMIEDARQRGVPRDGKAIVSGGLPGAGKSYTLTNRLGIDMDKYVVLNPDEFKERLIERTQVPGTEDGKFGPMEMAAVIHEESSDLTKMARDVFEASGYNVILDVTLGGAGEKAKGKHQATIEGLRARGYTVDGVFVDIPHEMSKESAKNRFLGGWANWMNGDDPMGGRFVPENVAAADVSTEGYNSSNRDNFEHVKELFNDYKTIDNSVRDDSAPLRVLDEGGNKHIVTPTDPFVSNAFDPFDDPVARLEALLAKMRANRAKVPKS